MSKYQERIISDPKILLGKPIIKGTRISVEFVLKKLSEGSSVMEIAQQHDLQNDDIYAVLDYASARLADRDEPVMMK